MLYLCIVIQKESYALNRRSTQALNALFPGNAAEANKAIGAQGIWEIDDVTGCM